LDADDAAQGAAMRELLAAAERQRAIDRFWASIDWSSTPRTTLRYVAPGLYVQESAPPPEPYYDMYVGGQIGTTEFERRLGGRATGILLTLGNAAYELTQLGLDTIYQNVNTMFSDLPRQYLPSLFQGPYDRWSARVDGLVGAVTSPIETGSRIWGNVTDQWNLSWQYEEAGDVFTAERIRWGLYTEGALLVGPFVGPALRGVGRLGELGLQWPITVDLSSARSTASMAGAGEWFGFRSMLRGDPLDSAGFRSLSGVWADLPPQIFTGEIPMTRLGGTIVVDTRATMQALVDHAYAELTANPGFARYLIGDSNYANLVNGSMAHVNWGNAVERLVGAYIVDTPALRGVLSYQSRPFLRTMDFFGFEGYNLLLFDVTTVPSGTAHTFRSYGMYTHYIYHPGLPGTLTFP
jgi:hypothetical protein